MLMSKSVDNAAAREAGKRAMAVEAYSRALRQLPTILADNAGFDSSELVSNLRSAHYKGFSSYGLNLTNGTICDVRDLGIIESYLLKKKVVSSASEAAEQLIRVDHILKAPMRKRERQ